MLRCNLIKERVESDLLKLPFATLLKEKREGREERSQRLERSQPLPFPLLSLLSCVFSVLSNIVWQKSTELQRPDHLQSQTK